MNLLEAIILGIVQGLTEFLPISSTAHLRVVPELFGWSDPGAAFTAIIQLGTTAAVVVYFARDLWAMARAWVAGLVRRRPFETPEARLAWWIALGTVPVVVAGLLFKDLIEGGFRSLYVVAAALILLAAALWFAERRARHVRKLESIGLADGLAVGAAQALALIPGVSRSGVTLTAGLLLNLEREAAARFSFLLAVPATVGAGVFEMRHVLKPGGTAAMLQPMPLVVGTVVSFIVGYITIAGLLRFLRTRSTAVFIVYRFALGAAILAGLVAGRLQP